MKHLRLTRRLTTNRKGASITEVIVALTLFAVVMSSLAMMGVQVGHGALRAGAATKRTAAMAELVGRVQVLPFDSLPSRVGCTDLSTDGFVRRECVSVTDINARARSVTLMLIPENPQVRADTVTFERGKPATFNPLNLP
ncbi:MAG TPA: hypothetical protein VJ672_08250 [Gemmatimonadaceae bacterium]|nr:hypothetical protein [Gemmatimonadaceae bacterium]